MPDLDQHILAFFARHPNSAAGEIPPLGDRRVPRQTLSRRLAALVGRGELIRVGEGAGTRYLRGDLEAYLRIPVAQRPPVRFLPERATRDLPKFSAAQLQLLYKSAGPHGVAAEDTARAVRERLLVELSYASSSLEGNTYDLLQKEALIKYGQMASGKSAVEAKMILNHRDAIRYLLDNIRTVAADWRTLRDLHALLSDGLLGELGDSGRIRRRVVARRTGRVIANLPLLQASLAPLSFVTVDKEAYIRGLLAYYELGLGAAIAKAYLDAYPTSVDAYRVSAEYRVKSAEQIAVELRYQGYVRERVRGIILGTAERDAPLHESIPSADRPVVTELIRAQLESLHPGRAAPLGVRSDEIEAYLSRPAS